MDVKDCEEFGDEAADVIVLGSIDFCHIPDAFASLQINVRCCTKITRNDHVVIDILDTRKWNQHGLVEKRMESCCTFTNGSKEHKYSR